jgi:hypothetical protein
MRALAEVQDKYEASEARAAEVGRLASQVEMRARAPHQVSMAPYIMGGAMGDGNDGDGDDGDGDGPSASAAAASAAAASAAASAAAAAAAAAAAFPVGAESLVAAAQSASDRWARELREEAEAARRGAEGELTTATAPVLRDEGDGASWLAEAQQPLEAASQRFAAARRLLSPSELATALERSHAAMASLATAPADLQAVAEVQRRCLVRLPMLLPKPELKPVREAMMIELDHATTKTEAISLTVREVLRAAALLLPDGSSLPWLPSTEPKASALLPKAPKAKGISTKAEGPNAGSTTRPFTTPFTTPSKTSKAKGTLLGTLQSAEDSTGRVALHAQPEGKGEEEADEQPALATTPASAPPKAMSIYERMQRAAAAPALAPPAPTPPLADEQEI